MNMLSQTVALEELLPECKPHMAPAAVPHLDLPRVG